MPDASLIIHSSATSFSNVDPEWRTYCGLTADEVAHFIANGDPFGFQHRWKPSGQMTCDACKTAALKAPWQSLEEWLAT